MEDWIEQKDVNKVPAKLAKCVCAQDSASLCTAVFFLRTAIALGSGCDRTQHVGAGVTHSCKGEVARERGKAKLEGAVDVTLYLLSMLPSSTS